MQNFLSLMAENTFAIIIAVMGFFGCLAYGIAGKGMSVLYNESLSMTASSHPFIRQLKLRRENGMRINTSIHNTQAFVLKNMERYRYLNLSIDEYVNTAYMYNAGTDERDNQAEYVVYRIRLCMCRGCGVCR